MVEWCICAYLLIWGVRFLRQLARLSGADDDLLDSTHGNLSLPRKVLQMLTIPADSCQRQASAQSPKAQQTAFLYHRQSEISIDLGEALLMCSANLQQAMLKEYYCSTRVYWGVQHPGVEAKRRHQTCTNPDSVLGTVR